MDEAREVKEPDHLAVVETVSQKFSTEIRELRDLQEAIAKRHEEHRAETERRKDEERQAIARQQDESFAKLLDLQVQEAQAKQKRDATLNKLLAALLAIATSGGGAGIYLASQKPTDEERKQDAAPVLETVTQQSDEVEGRVEKAEKKIERLGEIAVELQVQQSDGIEYIGNKIDAAHPRQRGDVEAPDSVKAAKRKADKIKSSKAAKKLFKEEDDPTDPFAGL